MALRGSKPKREEERRPDTHRAPGFPVDVVNPADVAQTGLEIEVNPLPGPAEAHWHGMAGDLWTEICRDPAALWLGPAGWQEVRLMCEQVSRELGQVIIAWQDIYVPGFTGDDGEYVKASVRKEPIYGTQPMSSATLTALRALFSKIGIQEGDRLGIRKEVRFHDRKPHDIEASGSGSEPHLAIVKDREDLLG